MIHGSVNDDGEPIILIDLAGQSWPAIIDTGFNGDLELPEAVKDEVKPQYAGTSTSLLGGGQIVKEELFLVSFPFDADIVEAEATFVSGNSILIGTQLLREYRLEINFVTRSVLLEHVPT